MQAATEAQRTTIEDLPMLEGELLPEEAEQVRGGLLSSDGGTQTEG